MKNEKYYIIREIVRIVLGFIFLYASMDKIIFPARFAEVVYHYKVLPIEFLNLVAVFVPWIEAGLGIMLLLNIWVNSAAFVLCCFNILFIGLIYSAIARGLDIECGCFSLDPVASKVGWMRIFEDFLLLLSCTFLLWTGLQKEVQTKYIN